jgi:hypothetical protein
VLNASLSFDSTSVIFVAPMPDFVPFAVYDVHAKLNNTPLKQIGIILGWTKASRTPCPPRFATSTTLPKL